MDTLPEPPRRLLYELAHGQISEDDLDLLETMLRAEGLVDCPPALRLASSHLARSRRHSAASRGTMVERIIQLAQLVFDSWSAPQPATVRTQSSLPRQLLLRAQDVEISLHVQPTGGNDITLIGQVLGPASSAGEALLIRHATPASETAQDAAPLLSADMYGPVPIDDLGEFQFPRVHPARYVLSLELQTQHVDSVALELRGRPDDGVPQHDD